MQDLSTDPQQVQQDLAATIAVLKTRYVLDAGDWEFTLWGLIEGGLTGFWEKSAGLGDDCGVTRDEVIGLRRMSKACHGWFHLGAFIGLDDWLAIYRRK